METTGYWPMACKYGICCYHLTSILDTRPQPDHPRHSIRTCLHHLLLDTHQSHAASATQRHFIWMICYCFKCSIYPAVVFSRWRLWEWFQHWLTNTFTKKHHAYTMSPVWNMLPSTQHAPPLAEQSQHHLADFHMHLPDQYVTAYHLTGIVMQYQNPQNDPQHQSHQMRKKISRQYL